MTIDIYCQNFTKYDGVSNNVLLMRAILLKNGFESNIYTDSFIIPKEYSYVKRSYEYKSNREKYLIIVVQIGASILDNLDKINSHIIIHYQGITPARYFINYSGPYYEACLRGEFQIRNIVSKNYPLITSSKFLKDELESYGFSNIYILPPAFDLKRLKKKENKALKTILSKTNNILFVGRISPNKCVEDIIKAFSVYKKYFDKMSTLYIVGSSTGMDIYQKKLDELIKSLKLKDVYFEGKVSEENLVTYYKNSKLFICMSEHEGYFLPAIESKLFKLPIIAYSDSGAVPETVGKGGLFVDQKDFVYIASLMNEMITNSDIRSKLIQAQNKEITDFKSNNFQNEFISIMKKIMNL